MLIGHIIRHIFQFPIKNKQNLETVFALITQTHHGNILQFLNIEQGLHKII